MPNQAVQEVLRRARDVFNTASRGLEDTRSNPARRITGIHNAVVFGRAVTNVLENLRSKDSRFDGWYAEISAALSADPLMKYFYKLRSQILKQGVSGTSTYAHIKKFNFPQDMRQFGPPPANARGFFIGDQHGGSGWEVDISQGVVEKFYVELPPEIGVAGLYFRDTPGADQSAPPDLDAVALCGKYLDRKEDILKRAESFFNKNEGALGSSLFP